MEKQLKEKESAPITNQSLGGNIKQDADPKMVHREAGQPGGKENAAGTGGEKNENQPQVGTFPVDTDSLNYGEQNKK